MRPLTAYINLKHLKHNYQYLKAKHGARALAVVKADAYGHGAVPCATALKDVVDGFAVAFLAEAIELRNAGINNPIVLLEGVFKATEYTMVDELQLSPVIQNHYQLDTFLNHAWQYPITIWLKIDTGMRRVGFLPEEYAAVYRQLINHPKVAKIINMTHFACADETNPSFTNQQFMLFQNTVAYTQNEASVCNSAAILSHADKYSDWSRIGLALYGVAPAKMTDVNLKPVMSLISEVVGVKVLNQGESIGYGAIFKADKQMRVGLVACGYADGYPRIPSNDNPVMIDGVKSRIIGRISMDMLSVELLDDSQGLGSQVELWGEHISVNEIANRAGTIAYEILCHLKRATKVYLE